MMADIRLGLHVTERVEDSVPFAMAVSFSYITPCQWWNILKPKK